VEEAFDFLGATMLERLRFHHLIDVMHVEKNMCVQGPPRDIA
jgi:hypothetical protein